MHFSVAILIGTLQQWQYRCCENEASVDDKNMKRMPCYWGEKGMYQGEKEVL